MNENNKISKSLKPKDRDINAHMELVYTEDKEEVKSRLTILFKAASTAGYEYFAGQIKEILANELFD